MELLCLPFIFLFYLGLAWGFGKLIEEGARAGQERAEFRRQFEYTMQYGDEEEQEWMIAEAQARQRDDLLLLIGVDLMADDY